MEIAARMTSKGQITVPKAVREALGLSAGDLVYFRVGGGSASLAKDRDFLTLAGSIEAPLEVRGRDWAEIVERAKEVRASRARTSR
jgi:AbrB family looped-hinge helix DNA binding protein